MTPNAPDVALPDREAPGASTARSGHRPAVEMPTLLLILADYAGWLAITFAYGHWPLAVVAPVAAVLITLHSSLQHEIVHGHPTRWYGVNRLLVMLPLSLWLPYDRYRHLHRIHHVDVRITDPLDDPESFYWTPEDWARLPAGTRAVLKLQQTLAGRVLVGSFWRIGMFLHAEWRLVVANRDNTRRVWLEHLLWCVPVLLWVKLVCGMPIWLYIVAMAIPANGLLLIRSFAEHRARPEVPERIAIVERSWILGPLFLFNNLHALHHETPAIPWYQYNARYRRERARLLAANGGLVYSTYFDVARRYLFRAHDVLQHPTGRVPLKGP
jgi:fatty acid desaturase